MEPDFLEALNPSQKEAVRYVDGPSLVIAGAGSGKTRVLTYKIAYLLHLGLKPWEILALTFTNKAAREMKERIDDLVGAGASRALWMGTFHSLFNRMLRTEAERMGYTPNYTIYQPSDCISLIKTIIKEKGLDDKTYKPSAVLGRISEAKNALVLPEDYCNSRETYLRDAATKVPAQGEIYRTYCERCHKANVMDFDDLLLQTYLLFERYPEVKEKYAARFKFILVDEYQDTNRAQYRILWQLSEKKRRVCVVGDDAQSIYSFRGARIDNILQFTTQYEGARLFKLEQNYRSTQTIVGAANSLIACNRNQIKKEVYSRNEVGQPILLSEAFSDVVEGEIVTNHIVHLHTAKQIGYGAIAILYRTNAQSRIFEDALRKRAIPYRIYGGRSFYDQKVVRDALAYFRLIINPNDEEAFKRIVNFPARGIGQTTLSRVMTAAAESGLGVWDVLDRLPEMVPAVGPAARTKLQSFKAMMDGFMEKRDTADAYQMGQMVMKESGLMALAHRDQTPESMEMRDNFSELLNGMSTFVDNQREENNENSTSLSDYLSEVSLLSDQDEHETEAKDMVTLMTVHAAKGLEFDAVLITGLEENLFPNALAMNNQRELEEERRLFYVAITRAKKYCYLSYSKMRYHFGSMDFCEPSRFLREIDRQYVRMERSRENESNDMAWEQPHRRHRFLENGSAEGFGTHDTPHPASRSKLEPARLRRIESSDTAATEVRRHSKTIYQGMTLEVGRNVEHAKFGRGVVTAIEGEEGEAKAVIRFDQLGEKHLLLKYAKLTLL